MSTGEALIAAAIALLIFWYGAITLAMHLVSACLAVFGVPA